ncbi:MAG: hypothetical protein ACPGGK_03090 [Pikeienuella sp.]
MDDFIWLTNIDTAEPVGVPVTKVVLIEQKRAQDGGAVALYLEHGKEVFVSESLNRIREMMCGTGVSALRQLPPMINGAPN